MGCSNVIYFKIHAEALTGTIMLSETPKRYNAEIGIFLLYSFVSAGNGSDAGNISYYWWKTSKLTLCSSMFSLYSELGASSNQNTSGWFPISVLSVSKENHHWQNWTSTLIFLVSSFLLRHNLKENNLTLNETICLVFFFVVQFYLDLISLLPTFCSLLCA